MKPPIWKDVVTYWHDSLVEAARLSAEYDPNKASHWPMVHLRNGWMPPDFLMKYFGVEWADAPFYPDDICDEYTTIQEDSGDCEEPTKNDLANIKIWVLPAIVETSERRYKNFAPVWIQFKVNAAGKLLHETTEQAWLYRNSLNPNNSSGPEIGSFDNYDAFVAHERSRDIETVADQVNYAEDMLRSVTGKGFSDLEVVDETAQWYVRNNEFGVMLASDSVDYTKGIRSLYVDILKGRESLPLLQRFSSPTPADLSELLADPCRIAASKKHCGQMSSEYPLSVSQRESIQHYISMGEGDVLAINGPPGTGKTTLLQSVVATEWVGAAITGQQPPIIVAMSTNNRAVTNILRSFADVKGDGSVLSQRWLPKTPDYGVYWSNEGRTKDDTKEYLSWQRDLESYGEGEEYGGDPRKYLSTALDFYFSQLAELMSTPPEWLKLLGMPPMDVGGYKRDDGWLSLKETFRGWLRAMKSHMETGLDLLTQVQQARDAKEQALTAMPRLQEELQREKRTLVHWNGVKSTYDGIITAWALHFEQEPILVGFLAQLFNYFKERIRSRNKAFLARHNIPFVGDAYDRQKVSDLIGEISRTTDDTVAECTQRVYLIEAQLQIARGAAHTCCQAEAAYGKWCADNGYLDNDLDDQFDKSVRYRMFCIAGRYWEIDFLDRFKKKIRKAAEAEEAAKKSGSVKCADPIIFTHKSKIEEFIDNAWMVAALCPLTVITCHSLPGYAKIEKLRPWGFIDLLIVDESGQVAPQLAGASMSLAKKALCVGDPYQIQPVVSMPWENDRWHMAKYRITDKVKPCTEANLFALSVSKGSVIRVAQHQCRYQRYPEARGLMLVEHRRCVDTIIDYCNELVYNGRLIPMTKKKEEYLLPHMAHMMVKGQSERPSGGSRCNHTEAGVIAAWIMNNADCLMEWYQMDITKIIGVVTPFTQQAGAIKKKLAQGGNNLGDIQVGTVHTFQGAEFPVVLFSGTYGESDKGGKFFFDSDKYMLNVAISRAKDTFIWVGDVSILPRSSQHPSGLLTRWILGNEIDPPLEPAWKGQKPGLKDPNIRCLDGHDAHISFLLDSLRTAKKSIVIASPWITADAVAADRLMLEIQACVGRGVDVIVMIDRGFNLEKGQWKQTAEHGIRRLLWAGACIKVFGNHHDKQVLVDVCTYAAGSFNWLSAPRDPNNPYFRYNVTVVTFDSGVVANRAAAITALEKKVLAIYKQDDPGQAQTMALPVPRGK